MWQKLLVSVGLKAVESSFDLMKQQQELKREREQREHERYLAQNELDLKRMALTGNLKMAMIDGSVQLAGQAFNNYRQIQQIKGQTEQMRIQADVYIQGLQTQSSENIQKIQSISNENIKQIDAVTQRYQAFLNAHNQRNMLLLQQQQAISQDLDKAMQGLSTSDRETKQYLQQKIDYLMNEQKEVRNQLLTNTQTLTQLQMEMPQLKSLDNASHTHSSAISYQNSFLLTNQE